MFTSRSRKWIAVLVGVLTLVLLTGVGTVLAAQTRQGPSTSSSPSTPSACTASQTGHEQELVGIVQSVDQAKQTFALLPTGQTTAVTIAYDAHTDIHHDHQTMPLAVGMSVVVHVLTRSDGSLYATEIEPGAEHGSMDPTGTPGDSSPHGSCDGTGPHHPDNDHDQH